MIRKTRKIALVVMLCGLAVALFPWLAIRIRYPFLLSYTSPDTRHEMRVYRDVLYFGFPGSSMDAAGYVTIIRREDNSEVGRYCVDMVALVNQRCWNRIEFDASGAIQNVPMDFQEYSQLRLLGFTKKK